MLLKYRNFILNLRYFQNSSTPLKCYSTAANPSPTAPKTIDILKNRYEVDNWTNVTPKIISRTGLNLHIEKYHPLSFVRQRIVNYFYKNFKGRTDSPIFSVHDTISPVVTIAQNYDSLLIPPDHPSRSKTQCYYINKNLMLRAHTTAHQSELIGMGLDNFLIVGEVFRRDEIDSKHYPVFHQLDAVRTLVPEEVFKGVVDGQSLKVFEENGVESPEKQKCHTLEAVKIMEYELKSTLVGIARDLFGKDVEYRWTSQYFPFTHPSWELEVFFNDDWIEVCGCGIMRHDILQKAGTSERIGWAFGLGLERLAMCLYDIPDIRWFGSRDSGFLNQFRVDDIYAPIKFRPVSIYPQCSNDISFWLPEDGSYDSNDFYDLVRDVANETVEQIHLIDEFVHPKTKQTSHCYRIVYRHMERVLTQKEVSIVHNSIRERAKRDLKIVPR